MKNAIITYNWLNLGYQEAFEKVIVPRLDFLAKKWDAELIVCNKFNNNLLNENTHKDHEFMHHYNKSFVLKDVVGNFKKTLCIDADIVVSRKMPNVFELYEDGYFYAVLDGANGDEYCFHRTEEMIASQAMLGSINWTHGYYNVGFMIVEKQHQKIFDDENYKMFFRYSDQTKINYYLRKYKIPHRPLSREYNSMPINCTDLKISPQIVTLLPPDIISKNVYAAHAAAVPIEIKNDYIFKLNFLMP